MRYQQLFASYAIRNALSKGVKSGIIWHTQGSGKTALAYYSVKSLTDYFAQRNVVAKFYFIVDRIDLMEQATDEFAARGLVVHNAKSRKELMDDIASREVTSNDEGKPEIMVVNIQKFKEDKAKVTVDDSYSTTRQFLGKSFGSRPKRSQNSINRNAVTKRGTRIVASVRRLHPYLLLRQVHCRWLHLQTDAWACRNCL